jgi:CO/xanthine dehydrogenase FAD-binding subunit
MLRISNFDDWIDYFYGWQKDVGLDARVALTAVNPAPQLVKAAELLKGQRYSLELVDEVAHQAICTGKPLRTSASTPEYRRRMIRVFVRRALDQLWHSR